jgi:hypothetical protein
LLFGIRFPHRNDAASRAARSPNENDHPGGEVPDRNKTRLTIVLPIVLDRQRHAIENQSGIRHIETATFEGGMALGGIELDLHDNKRYYNN